MAEKNEVYTCRTCKNVVSVVDGQSGTLSCCGAEMAKLASLSPEKEGKEKHIPVLSVEGNKVTVEVGSVHHPMAEDHSIELVQLLQNGKVIFERRLYPGEAPVAVFHMENTEGLSARAFCNTHGFWASKE